MFDTDGPVAAEIAGLWWLLLALGTAVFAAFAVVLFVALRRAGRDRAEPSPRSLRRLVIGGGAVVPAVILVAVFAATVAAMKAPTADSDGDPLRVEIIGHQWWYEIRYPDHGIVTANELHLPVDRTIELELRSVDVIHSFWIPGLAGKLDMLPDRSNTMTFSADETGEHTTSCAEFCGLQHTRMRLLSVVQTTDDFAAWLTANGRDAAEPQTSPQRAGREVFATAKCGACHTVRGSEFDGDEGPDLTHIASRQTLGAVSLDLDAENLRAWVADPHQFKKGVAMPATDLADDELDALIAYLESLP